VDQNTNLPIRPFLLMEGGPIYNIQKRIGIIKKDAPLNKKRALVAALITWLPLLILSALEGTAFGHSVAVPFLRDFSTYTRFLLAVPLLLLAENILAPHVAEAADHFVTSGVLLEKDYKEFDHIVERGLQLRDSVLAEIIIAILAYGFSIYAFTQTAVHVTTWYATRSSSGWSLTLAGWWLIGFCIPFFQFLMFRWLWRLFLWFQFLARVRHLDIQLFPTHPDEAGGLGFIGETQRFFGALLFAFSISATGVMANDILYDKVPLKNYATGIGAYVVIALIIVVGPLAVFTGILLKTKRKGLREYGALATTYTGSFQKKWILDENSDHEPLLGTGDIQSLADLGNSYAFIDKMRPLPIDPRSLLHLLVATLLPLVPLLLTVMPLKDILKLLFKFLT
jgi:hypothetical protein